MLIIPVKAVANQTFQVQLGTQPTTLNIYQNAYGLFMDVLVNGQQIIGGVLCQNLNRIVRSLYLGFVGDFCWFDTEGLDDPVYTSIGTRFQLLYLDPDEA